MMRPLIIIAVILGSLGFQSTAEAGSRDLVICMPGSPGSTGGAQTYMAPFFRRIESLAGWPASSIRGSFHPSYASCLSKIRSGKPGFGVLSLGVYLEQRKRYKLQVLGKVNILYGAGNRLYLVVKKGKYKSLAELRGKKLTSDHLEEAKFLNKVMFDGKIDVGTHFKLRKVRSSVKGMRDVKRGRADATIINGEQLRLMKRRGYPLVVIHKSPALPSAPLVAFGKWASRADVQKMKKVAAAMCSGAAGRKLCRATGIQSASRANNSTYRRVVKKFGK